MTELRAAKIGGHRRGLAAARRSTPTRAPSCSCSAGARARARSAPACAARASAGHKVACAHLHHLNPLPANTGDVLRSFDRVLVPEMNTGQLAQVLRAKYLVDVESYSKVQGQPLFAAEIEHADRGAS